MVTNFEEYTQPLNDDELKLLDAIMSGFAKRSISNPILARDIVAGINAKLPNYNVKTKLTDARLRKIVHHIRTNSLQPLMATSKGYYLSNDPDEIRRQIQSLRDRASAISVAADGLAKFLITPPKTLFDLLDEQFFPK